MQSKQFSRGELQAIPKVELHRHLEGALRLSTVAEVSTELHKEVPFSLQAQKDHFLVMTPMKDLKTVLDKFWRSQAILHSEEVIARITYEAIEDAAKEGIKILELRYSLTFILENHPNLDFYKIHTAVMKGVSLARDLQIAVGIICTIQRTLSIETAQKVLDFVLEHKNDFIGLDLADDELAKAPAEFVSVFSKAAEAGINITIHAGESIYPTSAQSVKDAIENLSAKRIGHGLQIYRDTQIVEFVRSRGIPLELCPTSNYLTNSIPHLESHPIRQLLQAGVLVTINSDDPGIFGIDLTNEYEVLQKHHGFTLADFSHCNDIAAQASFIPLIKKQKFWPRPIHTLR